jgi:hypothetical protein
LTEMAKEGKLDPTIGRDEGTYMLAIPSSNLMSLLLSEIRRTIQSKFSIDLLASTSQNVVSCYFIEGMGLAISSTKWLYFY